MEIVDSVESVDDNRNVVPVGCPTPIKSGHSPMGMKNINLVAFENKGNLLKYFSIYFFAERDWKMPYVISLCFIH